MCCSSHKHPLIPASDYETWFVQNPAWLQYSIGEILWAEYDIRTTGWGEFDDFARILRI
jgi:hypothetical protein